MGHELCPYWLPGYSSNMQRGFGDKGRIFFRQLCKMFPFKGNIPGLGMFVISLNNLETDLIIIIRNVISRNNFYDDDSVCSPHQAAGADRRGLMVCPDVL